MSLADHAMLPIDIDTKKYGVTCHSAVWFYAAKEAQERNLSEVKTTIDILVNISRIPQGVEPSMLNLARERKLFFCGLASKRKFPTEKLTLYGNLNQGDVFVWDEGTTHSAVVTGVSTISGYNQGAQWLGTGGSKHSTNNIANLAIEQRKVRIVPEDIIVMAASAMDL